MVQNLKLEKIELIHGRAEKLAHQKEYRERYDVVTARAVANLKVLLEYTIPFIKVNGRSLLLKGTNIDKEVKELNNIEKELSIKYITTYKYRYIIENQEYIRFIIEHIKTKKISDKYPRGIKRIKKEKI